MSPKELHIEGSRLVAKARQVLEESNDEPKYLSLLSEAFVYFKDAANQLRDKLSAEPTRSVLYRSAASLALQIGKYREAEILINTALLGNAPYEIQEELRVLYKDYILNTSITSKSKGLDLSYLMELRSKALNLKVEPISSRFSHAVTIKSINNTLGMIEKTWSNFTIVNFIKDFSSLINDPIEKVRSLGQEIANDTPILSVNQGFSSFGISLSSDTVIMTHNKGYDSKIETWRKSLFERFKDEIFFQDFNDEKYANVLEGKYSPEERHLIFGSFLKTLDSKSKVKISLTDNNYSEKIRTYIPIRKQVKQKLLPKLIVDAKEEKSLFREFYLKSETSKPGEKKKVVDLSKMTDASFNWEVENIESPLGTLFLKEQINFPYNYSEPTFEIESQDLGIYLTNSDPEELKNEFQREILYKYKTLFEKTDSDLSVDEKEIKDYFKQIVAMHQLNNN